MPSPTNKAAAARNLQQCQIIYPYMEECLDYLSLIDQSEFSLSNINETKKNKITTYFLDRLPTDKEDDNHNKIIINFEELVKVWFLVGVIGIKKTNSLIIYSSFDKPNLDITDMKREFIVHPLFDR